MGNAMGNLMKQSPTQSRQNTLRSTLPQRLYACRLIVHEVQYKFDPTLKLIIRENAQIEPISLNSTVILLIWSIKLKNADQLPMVKVNLAKFPLMPLRDRYILILKY